MSAGINRSWNRDATRSTRDPAAPIIARFDGVCAECSNPYPVGAAIRKWNGSYAHAGCTKGRKAPIIQTPSPKQMVVISDIDGNYPDMIWSRP